MVSRDHVAIELKKPAARRSHSGQDLSVRAIVTRSPDADSSLVSCTPLERDSARAGQRHTQTFPSTTRRPHATAIPLSAPTAACAAAFCTPAVRRRSRYGRHCCRPPVPSLTSVRRSIGARCRRRQTISCVASDQMRKRERILFHVTSENGSKCFSRNEEKETLRLQSGMRESESKRAAF